MGFAIVFAIFFIIFELINYYLFSRLSKLLTIKSKKVRNIIVWVVSTVSNTIIVVGFLRSMIFESLFIKSILRFLFSYWLGIFMYLCIFIILADIITIIICIFKKTRAKKATIRFVAVLCAFIAALSTSVYGFINATVIKEKEYTVFTTHNSLQKQMNIVLVSDLHLGAEKSEVRLGDMVKRINRMDADIVCIAGDMFDNDIDAVSDKDSVINVLSKIESEYGVYVAFGNHDSSDMIDFVDKCGFVLLSDEFVTIDDRITLAGRLDAAPINGTDLKRMNTEAFLEDVPDNLPLVVIDHNPKHVSEYKGRADLVLSGHTHKGQCFPGSIITSLIYDVDYGCGVVCDVPVVVSSGFGTWGMPMRVGTDSEIVQVKLK